MNRVAEHGGARRALPEWTRPRRVSVFAIAAALTATLFAATAPAEDEQLLRGGNGPGPAANGPGPGCNLIPPLASTGTKVDISQFPPPDSLTGVNVPSGSPRGTVTLPLFKGAVQTPSGLKPAWYVILDAGNQAEAERLGVNFSKKLPNAGDAARPATRRSDGTFLFESGVVD